MRTIKKITSLLLVLSIFGMILCSCDLLGADPEKLVAEADLALNEKSYTMDMVIKYDSEGMKDAVDAFTSPKIKTTVNGDSFKIAMTFEKDGVDNGVTYTYVDGTLYTELTELGVTTSSKSTVSEANRAKLTEKLGAGATLSIDDFSTLDTQSRGGVSVITCTEIKDEALDALVKALDDQLELDATVAIKDVTLAIQITDGLYEVTLLTCDYVITTDTEVYTLTMTYAAQFKYGEVDEIKAPAF